MCFGKLEMIFKDQNVKKIFIKVVSYSSIYIFGPLVFLGIIGYIIDRNLKTGPKFLFIGIGLAFIFSNILLFRKRSLLSKKIEEDVKKMISD